MALNTKRAAAPHCTSSSRTSGAPTYTCTTKQKAEVQPGCTNLNFLVNTGHRNPKSVMHFYITNLG